MLKVKPAALAPLYAALLAAQKAAACMPIEMTERGSTPRGPGQPDEIWSYAPGHVVAERADQLLQQFGLLLLPEGIEAGTADKPIRVAYRLVHAETGAALSYTYSGPLFSAQKFADYPHCVAATERYAWRCTVLRVLAIPVVPAMPKLRELPNARVEAEIPATGWTHPDEPATVSVPPYSVERCVAAMTAWCEHEHSVRRAGDPLAKRPTHEDAMAAFLADNNLLYERRAPKADEWPALYYWLRHEALRNGYEIQEAA